MLINYLRTSKVEQQLDMLFDLYDINGNGTIEKAELVEMYQVNLNLKLNLLKPNLIMY